MEIGKNLEVSCWWYWKRCMFGFQYEKTKSGVSMHALMICFLGWRIIFEWCTGDRKVKKYWLERWWKNEDSL